MTPAAVMDTLVAPHAVESTLPDCAGISESICDYAACERFWTARELTTYEFRSAARRSDSKEALAQKYRSEIEYYLPYFEKTHGQMRLSKLPQFIKECAACFSYLYALVRRDSTALCFDNDTDKLWEKRMELSQIEERIKELQDDLYEAEEQVAELGSKVEAAEKAEKKGGAK